MIRTLIVDDSPLVREILRDFLESDGSFEIVDEGVNGKDGVEKALQLSPDLITMDIDMPVMNGLEAIVEISKFLHTAIVVISTNDAAKTVYDATIRGAMEFFSKDIFTSKMSPEKREEILSTLKHITQIKKKVDLFAEKSSLIKKAGTQDQRKIQAVVIASSTGGPMALSRLLSLIPEDFPVPILIVQHNTSGFDKGFVEWLDEYTRLKVRLAQEGDIPAAKNVYVAPTDRHLVINGGCFAFDDSEPVNNQKPAADVLFDSAAKKYNNALVSVVLTGMGVDGAEGTRSVKQAGGITIAQDENTSLIFGMPDAAFQTGCVDIVLPLDEIANQLVLLVKQEIKND